MDAMREPAIGRLRTEALANAGERLGITLRKSSLAVTGVQTTAGLNIMQNRPPTVRRLSNLRLGQNETLIFEELSSSSDESDVVNRLRLLTPHAEGQGERTTPLK
jgi:hypothetical protein